MKRQRGRPSIDDTDKLMQVARKIVNEHVKTPRSAIVQTLETYDDTAIRRLQRKWREKSDFYLEAVESENKSREENRITRTYKREIPTYPFSEAAKAFEKAFAPIKEAQRILEDQTKMFQIACGQFEKTDLLQLAQGYAKDNPVAQLHKHLEQSPVYQLQKQLDSSPFRLLAEQIQRDQKFINSLKSAGWF